MVGLRNFSFLANIEWYANHITLDLKSAPRFAPCALWAHARLKTPRLDEVKPTIRDVRVGRLDALHALCASLLSWVINLCLFVRKRSKTWNSKFTWIWSSKNRCFFKKDKKLVKKKNLGNSSHSHNNSFVLNWCLPQE